MDFLGIQMLINNAINLQSHKSLSRFLPLPHVDGEYANGEFLNYGSEVRHMKDLLSARSPCVFADCLEYVIKDRSG